MLSPKTSRSYRNEREHKLFELNYCLLAEENTAYFQDDIFYNFQHE